MGDGTVPVDELLSPTKELEQRLANLEANRHQMVQIVLEARAMCEKANSISLGSADSRSAQDLLSAAVQDLEDLDGRLHEARLYQGQSYERAPQGRRRSQSF